MHALRRSCQWAVRSPNGSKRAFSTSCARPRGALPVFLEPSSPELTTLLSTFNAKVLLPAHLTAEQQQLVYKQENKAKLEAEPVEITLGDVTLPLEPLVRTRLPKRFQTFRDIVRKSETRDDWENVIRALEGFENAGIRVKPDWQELVVRHLNLSGNHHLILKALQRAKATGLRMREYKVLLQVLRAVHDKAALSEWDKDETAKALRFAKQVVELLEDEEHCGATSSGETALRTDFRGYPGVIALPTELAAVLAERHGGNVQEVKTLASRLVASLKQDDFEGSLSTLAKSCGLPTSHFSAGFKQFKHLLQLLQDLVPLVLVWNALKTSRKVLGADMPDAEAARGFEERTEKMLMHALADAERLQKRDDVSYDNKMLGYVEDAIQRCR